MVGTWCRNVALLTVACSRELLRAAAWSREWWCTGVGQTQSQCNSEGLNYCVRKGPNCRIQTGNMKPVRQVRASTLPTPTQHAIVSPFGGALGGRRRGGLGSGMSGRDPVHRLAARLTDPSAVFLCNVHTVGVAAGAPPRGLRSTRAS